MKVLIYLSMKIFTLNSIYKKCAQNLDRCETKQSGNTLRIFTKMTQFNIYTDVKQCIYLQMK